MAAPRRSTSALAFALLLTAGCGLFGDENDGFHKESPPAFKNDAPSHATPSSSAIPENLVDHDGKPVDLTAYRGKKNVVLVITRGIPQAPGGIPCAYCIHQVSSLSGNKAAFDARDAEVLFLFPGPSDQVGYFIQLASPVKKTLPYPLLLDKDMGVCDKLGIRGDLAKPSTYILDKKGNVVYAYVGETLTDRPSVKGILAQLDRIQGGKPPTRAPAPPTAASPPAADSPEPAAPAPDAPPSTAPDGR